MKRDICSRTNPATGCQSVVNRQEVQPFPSEGPLLKNLGLPLPMLTTRIGKIQSRAYSYVVRTVKLNRETTTFEQHGSAPNFQGDALTLCTCKHQMRSSLSATQWQNDVWIVGFTSRTIYDGKHWLFYLAKVKSALDSHTNLWSRMKAESRNAKAAHLHYLGDLFKPRTPMPNGDEAFSPSRYLIPENHVHRQYPGHKGWRNDINYRHAAKFGHPSLLVADPRQTFLWEEPMIFFAQKHCRNYLKWTSLQELVCQLRERR